jgi:hypothetical protein
MLHFVIVVAHLAVRMAFAAASDRPFIYANLT